MNTRPFERRDLVNSVVALHEGYTAKVLEAIGPFYDCVREDQWWWLLLDDQTWVRFWEDHKGMVDDPGRMN